MVDDRQGKSCCRMSCSARLVCIVSADWLGVSGKRVAGAVDGEMRAPRRGTPKLPQPVREMPARHCRVCDAGAGVPCSIQVPWHRIHSAVARPPCEPHGLSSEWRVRLGRGLVHHRWWPSWAPRERLPARRRLDRRRSLETISWSCEPGGLGGNRKHACASHVRASMQTRYTVHT